MINIFVLEFSGLFLICNYSLGHTMKLFQRSYHCQGEHGNCVAQQKRGHNMHDAAKP
jgi:hypothetical protein